MENMKYILPILLLASVPLAATDTDLLVYPTLDRDGNVLLNITESPSDNEKLRP